MLQNENLLNVFNDNDKSRGESHQLNETVLDERNMANSIEHQHSKTFNRHPQKYFDSKNLMR
jgi:hypothetical protein